jgi:hypothetical protein
MSKEIRVTLKGDYTSYKVGQYVDYMANDGSDVNRVMALTGMSRDNVCKLSISQIQDVIDFFEAVLQNPVGHFQPKWKHKGVTYGFHPYIDAISFREWMDLNAMMKDFPKSMPYILAVLYRPVVAEMMDRYEIEEYNSQVIEKRVGVFREMPLHYANGCMVFFSLIKKRLLIVFQEHLEDQTIEQMEKAMEIMEKEMKYRMN